MATEYLFKTASLHLKKNKYLIGQYMLIVFTKSPFRAL